MGPDPNLEALITLCREGDVRGTPDAHWVASARDLVTGAVPVSRALLPPRAVWPSVARR